MKDQYIKILWFVTAVFVVNDCVLLATQIQGIRGTCQFEIKMKF